jgi:predicted acetyltransferase
VWEVPTTELWFVDETHYFGTLMIRHRLPPALAVVGGHLGYHVMPAERRRGHATAMVGKALGFCCELGLDEILVTCAPENVGSRRAIEASGGTFEGIHGGECRYMLSSDRGQ